MSCGVCGSHDLEPVLSLGSSPPTCAMQRVGERGAEVHYPLELLYCRNCTLVQLSVIPDRDEVFPADYPYSSGNSPQLQRNFARLVDDIRNECGDLMVDIGANDGTLLRNFTGWRAIGVEPTAQAEKISGTAYREFFSEELARRIVKKHGHADVVTACNVLAHVDDIDDVMRGISHLLYDDGLLVAENGDLDALVDGGQWDFVYHEHLRYYSPYSFQQLLKHHGFGVKTWTKTPTHGGSFRMFARKGARDLDLPVRQHYDFAHLRESAARTRRQVRAITADGPVWGIGATARATTVINYCGLDIEDIECVCEVPGSDKIGRYIPGTSIPVVSEEEMIEQQPDMALLFSWHLKDVIVPNLRDRGYRGEICVLDPHDLLTTPVRWSWAF